MSPVLAFIGTQEIIVIAIVIIVIFGAYKLPQIGASLSKGILNFKRGMREVKAEDEAAKLAEENKGKEETECDNAPPPSA